jgi:hypothetical protein
MPTSRYLRAWRMLLDEAIPVLRRLARGAVAGTEQSRDLRDPSLDQEYLRSRTWLSVEQVIAYLDFPSPAAVRDWASRHGIRKGRRGRTLVFRGRTWTKPCRS